MSARATLLRHRIPTAGERFERLENAIRVIGLALEVDSHNAYPEKILDEGELRALRALLRQADEQTAVLREFVTELDEEALDRLAPDPDDRALLEGLDDGGLE